MLLYPHRYSLNTRQFVQSRGELDNTNIDTVIVLGEKPGSSGNASAQVSLPLTSVSFSISPALDCISNPVTATDGIRRGPVAVAT